MKPGLYQARIFVREGESGLIGTANNLIEIPNMKGDRLAVSSIVTDVRHLKQPSATAQSDGATLSQRRFPRGSEFAYMLVIYYPKPRGIETRLEMKVRVLRGSQIAYDGAASPIQPLEGSTPRRIIAGGILRLGKLEAENYTLELTVVDPLKGGRGSVRQEMDFTVE